MSRALPIPARHHGFLLYALLALLAAAALARWNGASFTRFFGPLPPLAILAGALVLGLGALEVLHRRNRLPGPERAAGPGRLAGIAALGAALTVLPVLIDLIQPFPADINVLPPAALLFYPAMALVAEVQFHLLPLALLALLAPRGAPVAWLIAPVVLIEPAFQVAFGAGPPLQSLLVAAHVGLFSALQLLLFFRHGFLAMLALRLGFYLGWHILWGTLRLELLP